MIQPSACHSTTAGASRHQFWLHWSKFATDLSHREFELKSTRNDSQRTRGAPYDRQSVGGGFIFRLSLLVQV